MSFKTVYHTTLVLFLPLTMTYIFFIRLFVPHQSLFMIPDFGESDVLHLNIPMKKILSDALKDKRWPLWSSDIASGFPLFAEGQIGTFFLPNLLLYRFFPFVLSYNAGLLTAYITAIAGSYLLYKCLGYTRFIASFCATVFTYSGFFAVHLSHYNLVQTATMLPLIMWAGISLYRRPTYLKTVVFAFLLSQQIFAGYLPIVFVTLTSVSVWWVIRLIIDRYRVIDQVGKCVLLCLATLLAVGFSAVQLVPTFELWQRSFRLGGLDFASATAYPYPPRHLITFLFPYFFGSPSDGSYPPFNDSWGIFWENTAYIGILPLVLAILGALFALRHRIVLPFFGLLIISLLLVTGKYSPFYLLYSLPPFSLFRVPSRFLLITLLSLTVLMGFGLTKIVNTLEARFKKGFFISVTLVSFATLFFIADGFAFSYNYPPVSGVDQWLDPPKIVALLPQGSTVASIGAPQKWNDVFLSKGWKDIAPYYFFKNNLFPNSTVLFGLKNFNFNTGGLHPKRLGYFTSMGRHVEFNDQLNVATLSAQTVNVLSLSATAFITSPYILNEANVVEVNSVHDEAGRLDPIRLYRLNFTRPRAYLANTTQLVTTLEEASSEFSDPEFLSRGSVLVERDDLIITSSQTKIVPVTITHEEPTSLSININAPEKSLLAVADNNYPGWVATVDGKPATIETVNLTQRGIRIEKGEHQVFFEFRPVSFLIGKWITVLTGIIVFTAIVLKKFIQPCTV